MGRIGGRLCWRRHSDQAVHGGELRAHALPHQAVQGIAGSLRHPTGGGRGRIETTSRRGDDDVENGRAGNARKSVDAMNPSGGRSGLAFVSQRLRRDLYPAGMRQACSYLYIRQSAHTVRASQTTTWPPSPPSTPTTCCTARAGVRDRSPGIQDVAARRADVLARGLPTWWPGRTGRWQAPTATVQAPAGLPLLGRGFDLRGRSRAAAGWSRLLLDTLAECAASRGVLATGRDRRLDNTAGSIAVHHPRAAPPGGSDALRGLEVRRPTSCSRRNPGRGRYHRAR